jgi:hypothetical protein
MGFDLIAKRPKRGAPGYYRAGIPFMGLLRAAMRAAGVDENVIYRTFVSNDALFVTGRQAAAIAQALRAWLRGRNLVVDIAESDPRACLAEDALLEVLRATGATKEADQFARSRRVGARPVHVDRRVRKAIREFAEFCASSGGFHVD